VGSVLAAAGSAWAARAGGTSGVLWGAALTAIGNVLGNNGTPDDTTVSEALRAGYDALTALGGASLGDKTMLDALDPFVGAVERSVRDGKDWRSAWVEAVPVAQSAAEGTASMRPKIGRARPLAERSVGTPDAGAISLAMCVATVSAVIIDQEVSL